MTGGHRLRARHVIHTVGPIYGTGRDGEPELLRSCYHESLRLAHQIQADSIAFPCISTGVYNYPKGEACQIATDTIAGWLREHEHPHRVIFCCFGPADARIYRERLRDMMGSE